MDPQEIPNKSLSTSPIDYQFIEKLKQLPFVEKIYLYGSRARGDHRDRSDIDLAIVCPSANEIEWQKILDIVENADTLLHIDCLRYDQLDHSKFKTRIDQERIVLYG